MPKKLMTTKTEAMEHSSICTLYRPEVRENQVRLSGHSKRLQNRLTSYYTYVGFLIRNWKLAKILIIIAYSYTSYDPYVPCVLSISTHPIIVFLWSCDQYCIVVCNVFTLAHSYGHQLVQQALVLAFSSSTLKELLNCKLFRWHYNAF